MMYGILLVPKEHVSMLLAIPRLQNITIEGNFVFTNVSAGYLLKLHFSYKK